MTSSADGPGAGAAIRPPMGRALLGGLLGTALLTLILDQALPAWTGRRADLVGALAGLLGVGTALALLVHFVIGSVVFPALYAFVVRPRLGGAPFARGVAFGVLIWFGAELVFHPLAGDGLFHAEAGGVVPLTASFAAHLLYGLVLGAVAGGAERLAPQAQAQAEAARHEDEAARQIREGPRPQRGG